MSSNLSANPTGRNPGQADGDNHAGKGDNPVEVRAELQRSSNSSGNQTAANQRQSSGLERGQSSEAGFTLGTSGQTCNIPSPTSGPHKSKNEESKGDITTQGVNDTSAGGARGNISAAMEQQVPLEETPTPPQKTKVKRSESWRDFYNLDYSGHFKIKVTSKELGSGKNTQVLKMKTEEVQCVKFCHLFLCDFQLRAVKEALQSDLKLDVVKGGYPPSVCLQSGASHPVNVAVKSVLKSLCYQIKAVNISSTSWNIDQVKTTLSSWNSYRKGTVIGYEVSGDSATNYWLAGEGGSLETTIELLSQQLGPSNVDMDQQLTESHDVDTTDPVQREKIRSDATEVTHAQKRGDKQLEEPSGSDNILPRSSGSDNISPRSSGSDNIPPRSSGSDNIPPRSSGSDHVPPRSSGSGDNDGDHTSSPMGGRQVGDEAPHGTGVTKDPYGTGLTKAGSQKEAVNPVHGHVRSGKAGDIPFADDGQSGNISSLKTETQKVVQQELAEWSGQNANNPPQGSTCAPVDQMIDRHQVQSQIGVSRDPIGAPQGGQSAGEQNMTRTSPSTGDQYKPPGYNQSASYGVQPDPATSRFSTTLNLDRHKKKILSSIPILEDFRHKFRNLQLTSAQGGSHVLHIVGDEVTANRVKAEIQSQLKEIERERVDLSSIEMKPDPMNMLRDGHVLEYITRNIAHQQLPCYLEQKDNTTWVYATAADMNKVLQVIHLSIVCRVIEIDHEWRLFLDSPDAQQEMCDFEKVHNGKVVISTQESLVSLSCTADIEDEVWRTFKNMKKAFFEEGTKSITHRPDGYLTVKLCTKVLQDNIQKIEDKYCVKINPTQKKGRQGWTVKGPRGTLERASETLKKVAATVTSRNLPLMDKVTKEFFKTQPGQEVMSRVGGDTGCLVTMLDQEVDMSEGTSGAVTSDETSGAVRSDGPTPVTQQSNPAGRTWRSGNGRDVGLYCGDGRKSMSDVLVELTKSDTRTPSVCFYPDESKKIVVTLNLPEWRDGKNKEKTQIRTQFQDILKEAMKKGVTSLAILLDDCWRCGWEEKRAYTSLVKNTLYVLKSENAGAVSCTYFVSDQAMFMALRDAIDDRFKNVTPLTVTDETEEIEKDFEMIEQPDIREKKPVIVLCPGELAKMTSQVIVNTTDKGLKLDVGAVSASILKAAGPEIQTECYQYYHGVKFGKVAITRGYKLECERVFHGALPSYETDRELKLMVSFLWNCLTEADKMKYSTVSFPALGTGNLGYPRDLVARTMFDAVKSYFLERHDSRIERVNFVVYPKDTPTVKAFQDEEKKQRERILEGKCISEDRTSDGADPLGATGGVQTRSMTRDQANAQRRSAENSTKIPVYGTNLVVVSKLENNIEKAIQQLKNKISELQNQHQTELKRSETANTQQTMTKPTPPPRKHNTGGETRPEDRVTQDDHSTILERTAYEEKRLVLTSKYSSTLEKGKVEEWLKKSPDKDFKFTVVWPFLEDMKALIILESVNDAEKLLKRQHIDQYLVNKFPLQTVQNLKATLKAAMVATIKNHLKSDEIKSAFCNASGCTWSEENGTCFLSGSLPEIQCAYKYITKITAGGDGHQGDQNDHTDGGGATQGDTKGGDRQSSLGNGQNRHTKPDIHHGGTDGSFSDTTRGGDRQSSLGNGQNRHTKPDIPHGGTDGSFSDSTRGRDRQGSHGDTQPKDTDSHADGLLQNRSKNGVTQSQGSGSQGEFRQDPSLFTEHQEENAQSTTKQNIRSVRGQDNFSDQGRSSYVRKPSHNLHQSLYDNVDQHDNIRSKEQTRSSQESHDEGAIKKTMFNERKGQNDVEEEQNSDARDASLVNKDGNLRHREAKGQQQHRQDHQSGELDNLTDKNVDYDNVSKFQNTSDDGRKGDADRLSQPSKRTDDDDRIETLTCLPEQFHEICSFNPEIHNKITTEFSHDRSECYITDRFGDFRKAKDQHSCCARREINNLNEVEERLFKKYHKQENQNMTLMSILCDYNTGCKRIKLVGVKYDAVEQTEQMILKAIGRQYSQSDQQPTKQHSRGRKGKRPPVGTKVLQTKEGLQVLVYQEDLLDLDVDAIVHGAKCNLDNTRGLSRQIAEAAGPDLDIACTNVFTTKQLKFGDCCYTTAGNLHYYCIIHAVTPIWSDYKKTGTHEDRRKIYRDDLCKTILNALEEAVTLGVKSVALPAFGYAQGPPDILPAAFREAVQLYCEKQKNSSLKQIHFVDQNKDILKKISGEFAHPGKFDFSVTPLASTRASSSQRESGTPRGTVSNSSGYPPTYPQWMSKTDSGGTCRLSEKLCVCIMQGTYVKIQVSALVSIEDELFQSERHVAKEIGKVAGDQYRKEKDKIRNGKKRNISDVFHTSAGRMLNASHVLHVIGPVADKKISETAELFKWFADNTRACIYRVLQKVDEMKLDSVALPNFASGTLNHGQTQQLWGICVDEIERFAVQHPKSKLERIVLVSGSDNVQLLLKLFGSKVKAAIKESAV